MNRLILISILLIVVALIGVAGCGNLQLLDALGNVGGTVFAPSSLEPGIYTGESSCQFEFTIVATGEVSGASSSTPYTETIGNTGLPIAEGQEVRVGTSSTSNIGGFSTSETVTRVTTAENGVVVKTEGLINLELQAGTPPIVFEVTAEYTYKLLSQNRIDYQSVFSGIDTSEADVMTLEGECSAVLVR